MSSLDLLQAVSSSNPTRTLETYLPSSAGHRERVIRYTKDNQPLNDDDGSKNEWTGDVNILEYSIAQLGAQQTDLALEVERQEHLLAKLRSEQGRATAREQALRHELWAVQAAATAFRRIPLEILQMIIEMYLPAAPLRRDDRWRLVQLATISRGFCAAVRACQRFYLSVIADCDLTNYWLAKLVKPMQRFPNLPHTLQIASGLITGPQKEVDRRRAGSDFDALDPGNLQEAIFDLLEQSGVTIDHLSLPDKSVTDLEVLLGSKQGRQSLFFNWAEATSRPEHGELEEVAVPWDSVAYAMPADVDGPPFAVNLEETHEELQVLGLRSSYASPDSPGFSRYRPCHNNLQTLWLENFTSCREELCALAVDLPSLSTLIVDRLFVNDSSPSSPRVCFPSITHLIVLDTDPNTRIYRMIACPLLEFLLVPVNHAPKSDGLYPDKLVRFLQLSTRQDKLVLVLCQLPNRNPDYWHEDERNTPELESELFGTRAGCLLPFLDRLVVFPPPLNRSLEVDRLPEHQIVQEAWDSHKVFCTDTVAQRNQEGLANSGLAFKRWSFEEMAVMVLEILPQLPLHLRLRLFHSITTDSVCYIVDEPSVQSVSSWWTVTCGY